MFRIQNAAGSFLAGWQVSGERLEFFFSDDESEAYLFDDREEAAQVVNSTGGFFPMQIDELAA